MAIRKLPNIDIVPDIYPKPSSITVTKIEPTPIVPPVIKKPIGLTETFVTTNTKEIAVEDIIITNKTITVTKENPPITNDKSIANAINNNIVSNSKRFELESMSDIPNHYTDGPVNVTDVIYNDIIYIKPNVTFPDRIDNPINNIPTDKTILTENKFESLTEDGNYNDAPTIVEIIKEIEPIVIEQILSPIDSGVDKTAVTEIVIADKYFMITNVEDRKRSSGTDKFKFSFEYLSYLFFEININENVPSFYSAIDDIIEDKLFARDEDPGVIAEEDIIDYDMIKVIFSKIWNLAKASDDIAIKNLIGFYIYFNRRLSFLPILVQGTSLNEFISDLSLESIVGKLVMLGLYPINNRNLFERLWNSFTYTVKEDLNKSEIKMSLREFYDYDVNRDNAETYNGFTNKIDKLILLYDLDLSAWSKKRTFNTQSSAFKRFKELSLAYLNDNTGVKNYLVKLLPNAQSQYMRMSLVNNSDNIIVPDRNIWCMLQSFDDVFKINRLNISKENIRKLFVDFAGDVSFPIGEIESNNFTQIWIYWVEYLNAKASLITEELTDLYDVEHDYANLFDKLVDLVNSKFIIQYLQNNKAFQDTGYTDGTGYIDAALVKVYGSLNVLKQQIKHIIKYIVTEDSRFYSANA